MGAAVAGSTLFLGRLCAIRALSHGDLSHATPILGTKTVFVALLSSLLLQEKISLGLMAGAILTSLSVALLSWTPAWGAPSHPGGRFDRPTTLWALFAALSFALTDIVVQKYARLVGVGWFQPLMFSTLAILTPLLLFPARSTKNHSTSVFPPTSRGPVLLGSGVIGFQTSSSFW